MTSCPSLLTTHPSPCLPAPPLKLVDLVGWAQGILRQYGPDVTVYVRDDGLDGVAHPLADARVQAGPGRTRVVVLLPRPFLTPATPAWP